MVQKGKGKAMEEAEGGQRSASRSRAAYAKI